MGCADGVYFLSWGMVTWVSSTNCTLRIYALSCYCGTHVDVLPRSPFKEGPAAQLQGEWSACSLQLSIPSEPSEGHLP